MLPFRITTIYFMGHRRLSKCFAIPFFLRFGFIERTCFYIYFFFFVSQFTYVTIFVNMIKYFRNSERMTTTTATKKVQKMDGKRKGIWKEKTEFACFKYLIHFSNVEMSLLNFLKKKFIIANECT